MEMMDIYVLKVKNDVFAVHEDSDLVYKRFSKGDKVYTLAREQEKADIILNHMDFIIDAYSPRLVEWAYNHCNHPSEKQLTAGDLMYDAVFCFCCNVNAGDLQYVEHFDGNALSAEDFMKKIREELNRV